MSEPYDERTLRLQDGTKKRVRRLKMADREMRAEGSSPRATAPEEPGIQPSMILETSFGTEDTEKCHELCRRIPLLSYAKAIYCGGQDQDTHAGRVKLFVTSFLLLRRVIP